MRKRSAITIETTKNKPLSTLITAPKQRLDQSKYQSTEPSLVNTPDATSSANPSGVEIDPLDPPLTDQIAAGTTIYQRLTLVSGRYCPSYLPSFYRRVWFDGLEAFPLFHFTIDVSTGCIIPGSVLPATTVVTASYAKGY